MHVHGAIQYSLNVVKAMQMPMWHRIMTTLLNWVWFQRVSEFDVSCNDAFEQQRTCSYPSLSPGCYAEGRTVGTVRKPSPGTGGEKGPFVRQQRQDPRRSLSHSDKGGRGTLLSSVFFYFFSVFCSTRSLPGKLSARRKHPACSGPAWETSDVACCQPDTAREAAVKGRGRGEV